MGVAGPLTFGDLMAIIVLVAGIGTYQFFKGRKLNLTLMYYAMKVTDEVLKPLDKNYTLLGTYVGFTAIYDLEEPLRKAELTLTLMPRQSLFYYPVSLVTSRFDKVFIRFIFPAKIRREAHIVAKWYYRLGLSREIRGYERMSREEIIIKGRKYVLVYTSGAAVRRLEKFVKRLRNPSLIKHVALVPANRSLYLAVKFDPEFFKEILTKAHELALEFVEELG